MNTDHVLEIFIERDMISRDQTDDIVREVNSTGDSLVHVLTNLGYMQQDDFYQAVAQSIGTDYIELHGYEVPPEIQRQIPSGLAKLHGALPIGINDGGELVIALIDPLNLQTSEDLRFALNRPFQIIVAETTHVEELIQKYYGSDISNMDEVLAQLGTGMITFGGDEQVTEADVAAEANAAPIIRYVDLILQQAIGARASDIHFEPFESEFKIRYRVDGALYEMAPPPKHLSLPVISRVKVLANLNIAERRLPQDGRIQKVIGGRPVDLRVSTLPTQHGESVVLRVLDRSTVNLDLEGLGMPDGIFDYVCHTIEKPNGIFIVTGPTGAGKTTTLYSCLRRINTIDAKLLTAEDPVEYEIEGIIQVPVVESIGLTFGRVLRAFLRQDPDRIMIGEMRDLETAQIAIQASLTGHLVLSTLHTNDAPGAVTRLLDMGAEPFLLSATLEGVLAQRLLRKICGACRTHYEPTDSVLAQLSLSPHDIGDKNFFYGRGCDACNQTGYKGRKGIYELLDITDPLREMINQKAPTVVLKQKAIELGMITLRDDGLRNIYDGETTIEEVIKYT